MALKVINTNNYTGANATGVIKQRRAGSNTAPITLTKIYGGAGPNSTDYTKNTGAMSHTSSFYLTASIDSQTQYLTAKVYAFYSDTKATLQFGGTAYTTGSGGGGGSTAKANFTVYEST
jgi:hypothetical protein